MMSNETVVNPTWNKPHGGSNVAIIGCGPGGMFVCHAVETERLKLQEKIKVATTKEERTSLVKQLDLLPNVLCFEQADAPGGVWRSTKNSNAPTTGTGSASASGSAGAYFKTDTNMYEALWCNGPKEVMEFADYTFVDHFGKDAKLPLYLPRKAVLDYILTRVKRNCPNFFDKYARFETRVNQVTYDATTNQFTVVTTHLPTQTKTTAFYDKVIWSAGQNGSGKIPGPILHPFEEAQAKYADVQQQQQQSTATNNDNPPVLSPPPPFLHASSMEQKVAEQIKDRHLLLIGGSYSAEDLAFMGIKWGAKHITVLTRRHGIDVPVCWSTNWPDNKVTVVAGYVVDKVQVVVDNHNNQKKKGDDSSHSSYTVSLKKYAYEGDLIEVDETKATPKEEDDRASSPTPSSSDIALQQHPEAPPSPKSVVDPEAVKSIDNVDVVICCTGYSEHLEMLDKSCYNMSDEAYNKYWNGKDIMDLPANWTMSPNPLTGIVEKFFVPEGGTKDEDADEKKSDDLPTTTTTTTTATTTTTPPVQHIPPKRDTLYPGCYVNPYSYREFVFVHNPNLMWLAANNFDAPLLALDVQANYAVKLLLGTVKMPTLEQMKAENQQQAMMEMNMPMVRYWMDTNYYQAVQKWLDVTTRKVHYLDDNGNRCSRYEYPQQWNDAYKQTSQWELFLMSRLMKESDYPLQLGNFHELNHNGKQFMQINWGCRNYTTCSKTGTTFRDVDAKQCATIQSVLTGSRPAPLKGRWLDMDELMVNVTDMVQA